MRHDKTLKILQEYRKNPMDLESLTEEEAEKKFKDSKFHDRVSTQMLLGAIQQYRESHKAEQDVAHDG